MYIVPNGTVWCGNRLRAPCFMKGYAGYQWDHILQNVRMRDHFKITDFCLWMCCGSIPDVQGLRFTFFPVRRGIASRRRFSQGNPGDPHSGRPRSPQRSTGAAGSSTIAAREGDAGDGARSRAGDVCFLGHWRRIVGILGFFGFWGVFGYEELLVQGSAAVRVKLWAQDDGWLPT